MISTWQPVFDQAIPPIYRQDQPGRTLFYTPGWLTVIPTALASDFQSGLFDPDHSPWVEAKKMKDRALEAEEKWLALETPVFTPLCLTLYLNQRCNLDCVYCFSRPYSAGGSRLALDAIEGAAEIVAQNCRAQREPFTVVFHGGGEPTLDYGLILEALAVLEGVAAKYNLVLFRYIATNGILSQRRAAALANRFDLIGLSCDGPPEIQDGQRPLRGENLQTSSAFVEQTARAVRDAGKPLHVRVTITPGTLARQKEIAEYICRRLQPWEIHVEPVYAVERSGTHSGFLPAHAEAYVASFLEARKIARSYGVRWLTSGSRPVEIHSAYCHLWRGVLNLTPGGIVTGCFKSPDGESARAHGMDLGEWNSLARLFQWNLACMQGFHQAIRREPAECVRCFNRYHCARQCPDACILKSDAIPGGFRCQMQSMLTDIYINETADALCSGTSNAEPVIGQVVAQHWLDRNATI